MFDHKRNRTRSYLFDYGTKGIFRTPPLETSGHSDLTIVTMLRHEDVTMYLIAIKSLYSRIQHGAVIVVDDGTLTEFDQERVAVHTAGHRLFRVGFPFGRDYRGSGRCRSAPNFRATETVDKSMGQHQAPGV